MERRTISRCTRRLDIKDVTSCAFLGYYKLAFENELFKSSHNRIVVRIEQFTR